MYFDLAGRHCKVRWYRVPEGTPFIPVPHRFASRTWDQIKEPGRFIGESGKRKWVNGEAPFFPVKPHLCQPPAWWTDGPPLDAPDVALDADGVPVCCGPSTLRTIGGGGGGGRSVARIVSQSQGGGAGGGVSLVRTVHVEESQGGGAGGGVSLVRTVHVEESQGGGAGGGVSLVRTVHVEQSQGGGAGGGVSTANIIIPGPPNVTSLYHGHGHTSGGSGGGNFVTPSMSVTAGDLIVVCVAGTNFSGLTSPTFPDGGAGGAAADGFGIGVSAAIGYKQMSTTTSGTITIPTGASQNVAVWVFKLSGLAGLYDYHTNTGNSTGPSTAAVLCHTSDIAVAVVATNELDTNTAPIWATPFGYALIEQDAPGTFPRASIAFVSPTTAPSVTPSQTLANSQHWAEVGMTFH